MPAPRARKGRRPAAPAELDRARGAGLRSRCRGSPSPPTRMSCCFAREVRG